MSLGGGSASAEADRARREEQNRQKYIKAGTQQINEGWDKYFTPDFYDQRRRAYVDFATPQLQDQYGNAQRKLAYSLADAGLLNSSSRANQEGELAKVFALQEQGVDDQALNYTNEARSNVEQARAGVIGNWTATGDATAAASNAVNQAAVLSKPQGYSPIGQLFNDFIAGLNTQANAERAYAYGGPAPKYQTGLFAPSRSSVVVG